MPSVPEIEIVLEALGGMAQDSSALNAEPKNNGLSVFQQGWYRYARNCRIGSSAHNNVGSVENIASTLANTTYYTWNGSAWISGSAPAGTNKAIGREEDLGGGRIYWCVHNSNLDHQILMYSKIDDKIYELLKWSGLNFDIQHRVSMAQIGNFIGLTDYYNPPRLFDRTTIHVLKSTLAAGFSEFHISLLKWAPANPPDVRVDTTAVNDGSPKPKYLQFAYRIKYIGGYQSTWSPRSNFVTNAYNNNRYTKIFIVYALSQMFDYNDPNNTSFDYSSIKFQSIVEGLDFAYREASDDTWKIFATLKDPSVNHVFFDSIDTGPTITVADSEIGQPYDTVPLLSESIDAIDNRFTLGNNKDELPIETFRITDVEVYTGGFSDWDGNASGWTALTGPQKLVLDSIVQSKHFSFKEGGQYKIAFLFQGYGGRTSLGYTDDTMVFNIPRGFDSANYTEQNHALGFKIPGDVIPPIWATSMQVLRSNCLNIDFFGYGFVNTFRFLVSDQSMPNDPKSVTQAAQDIINNFFTNKENLKGVYEISSQLAAFVRHSIELTGINAVANCGLIYMEIRNWTLPTRRDATGNLSNPNSNLYYNFQQGDRVRFVASQEPPLGPHNLSELKIYDEEILYFDGAGLIVKSSPEILSMGYRQLTPFQLSPINALGQVIYRIEVYRTKKFNPTDEVLFYEMGEWYPIIKPTTADRDFPKRDWTWTNQASVTRTDVNGKVIYNKMPLVNGDIHYVLSKDFYYDWINAANDGTVNGVFTVQMNPDPAKPFGRWDHNNGRPFVAYKSIINHQEEKPTQVRFGNQYFQDGIFNGINNFRDEWQKIYPSEYGAIRALINTSNTEVKNVGNILLVIGESQAWSVYINRATLQDLSGRTLVTLSDKVLGSYNTLLGGHGTLNPESISKNNGRVIWWDAKKGSWIRYSQDGLTRISREYNMANWFNDLSDLLINEYGVNDDPKVLSVSDNYFDTWLTLIDHSSLPSTYRGYDSYKCVEFNEDYDEWKSIFDYNPDLFARLENDVYSIIGSTIHKHEDGADYGSFYGTKKDSMIEFVANLFIRQNKIWESVAVQATDKWSFPSIKGDFKSNGATIQESRLLLTDLELLEAVYWASLKNNKNTPNAANETAALINGDKMRSRSLTLMMQLDPDVDYLSVLNYLIVGAANSPKNVKK